MNSTTISLPQAKLSKAYTELAKIWTHPGVLEMDQKDVGRMENERDIKAYDSIDNFVCTTSDKDWADDVEDAGEFDRNAKSGKGRKQKPKGKGKKQKKTSGRILESSSDDEGCDVGMKPAEKRADEPSKWWDEIMVSVDENTKTPELSSKMLVMLQILKEAAASKEKILLFSQSPLVLELIERVIKGGADQGHSQR